MPTGVFTLLSPVGLFQGVCVTEVEAFLEKNRLFRCERLAASITKRQCELNRRRKENYAAGIYEVASCKGCSGLGSVVDIVMEVSVMSRGLCSIVGCEKLAQTGKNGMCKAHFSGSKPRPSRLVAVDIVPDAVPVTLPAPVAGVAVAPSVQEITNIDYIAYLRQLLDEKLEEWVTDLNSASTPKDRARRYLDMCSAAEGLGY